MRPSEPSLVQLWLSGGLDLSEQLQKEAPQRPAEDDDRRPAPGGIWACSTWASTAPCGCTTCWQAFCAWCCRPSCC